MKFRLYKIMHHECLVASTERARRFSEKYFGNHHTPLDSTRKRNKKVTLF
jgi:hypothetical protein